MTSENIEDSSEEFSESELKNTLKKRLELELGLPLTPKVIKQVKRNFCDDVILLDNFPVMEVDLIRINSKEIASEEYLLVENEGIIYLNETCSGNLYIEYSYGLSESEYGPLLELMMDYETDNSWTKDASSISEKNVSVSYDTSQGKGARIQSMIDDLRNKYSCVVDMI